MAFSYQPLICAGCGSGTGLKRGTGEASDSMVCSYCGYRYYIKPPEDDEKYLYFVHYENGVSELRALRFDRAAVEFREAYDLDPDRPDALWGLICAEYGIVQVKSYHDQKYNPIFCLVNYKERTPFAVNEQVRQLRSCIACMCEDYEIYRDWLADVERQIQRIMEATPKPHTWKWDVFIACKISKATERFPNADGKTPEHEEALRLHKELTERGLRVFYSEKYFVDNMGKPDSDWQIMTALLNSRQMLLVCGGVQNDEKLNTPWVRSEWMRWRSMQQQGVKREDSLIVYSISESTRSLPEGLFTGNTVYPSHRAELLRTLERNCYTDGQYDRDLQKGQELLSRSDFSEASRVFTHTAHMRPDCAEPHVYLFLCDLRVTRVSGLSEKHIEGSLESNPHYREAEARNNRAFCELFHDLKDRIQFLRDRQKDDKMAKMQEKMEELERQLQEKAEKTEREERDKKEPPAPMPIQTVRYSQGLEFKKLEDGTYAVKGIGTCKDTELVIPPTTPEGGKVTTIGKYAFLNCSGLTSVTIPNSVTTIVEKAFSFCSGLTSVTIPNSVTTIGRGAFSGCRGLTSVTIPNSVTTIGEFAFWGCSGLTSVTIPNSVTTIGEAAFTFCSGLTSITIPNGVESIEESAFSHCSGLTSVTIPNSVTEIGEDAFIACPNAKIYCAHPSKPSGWHDNWNPNNRPVVWNHKLGVSAPAIKTPPQTVRYSQGLKFEKLEDGTYAVKGIGTCKDTELVIPPTTPTGGKVTQIGRYAFQDRNELVSVDIPHSVTSIETYAFGECSGLTSMTIPNGVTSIVCDAFSACSGLTSIEVEPGNSKYYGQDNCVIERDTNCLVIGIRTSKIPNNVTSIGRFAFAECKGLTSITIPNSVKSIGHGAFYECSGLTSITIPNGVESIEESAFYDCSGLTSVTIPSSVTEIGQNAFSGCSGLTSITIPNSVTTIEKSTFSRCNGLTSVTIPNRVKSIGQGAFYECSGLTSITIPNSVKSIEKSAFSDCSGLTSVTIPSSVTEIGQHAFSCCSGLIFITIPDSVKSIGEGAFEKCIRLISVIVEPNNPKYYSQDDCVIERETKRLVVGIRTSRIPNSVKSIGDEAFAGCRGLTSVTIPNSVTSIGSKAFWGCKGLTSVTIPNNVTSIGSEAFFGCRGLTSITIPNSVTSIGKESFSACHGLIWVIVSNGVTSIGKDSFAFCSSLTSVTIPDSVTEIGNYAFKACPNVTIYCAHPSKPAGWNDDWNPDNRPVIWNYKP